MATQWRQLFDELGIEWRDRGRNCSKGHINIKCVFCWDDPSFHCAISESKDVFYCYRDGSHKGTAEWLLQRILGSRVKAVHLLEDYADDVPVFVNAPIQKHVEFEKFPFAFESGKMLRYLENRGFFDPELTCRRFNLRYAPEGTYAQRLLMPLIDENGNIQSFTGRAVRRNLEPTYKAANPDLVANLMYGSFTGKTIIVVEGPFDALKINSAMYDSLHEISAVALTGRVLTAARKNILGAYRGRQFLLALDRDVAPFAIFDTSFRLRVDCGLSVERLAIPDGYDDPGAMDELAIVEWLGKGTAHGVHMGRGV